VLDCLHVSGREKEVDADVISGPGRSRAVFLIRARLCFGARRQHSDGALDINQQACFAGREAYLIDRQLNEGGLMTRCLC
jgi:hypothetical protein